MAWTVIDATLIHLVSVERIQMTGGVWNVGRGDTARKNTTEVARKIVFGKGECLTLSELWKVKKIQYGP